MADFSVLGAHLPPGARYCSRFDPKVPHFSRYQPLVVKRFPHITQMYTRLTSLGGGACRELSLLRLMSRWSGRLPELAGGERPAVAAVAVGWQGREVARRVVEPPLAPLGLHVPLALDVVGHVALLEADRKLQRRHLLQQLPGQLGVEGVIRQPEHVLEGGWPGGEAILRIK